MKTEMATKEKIISIVNEIIEESIERQRNNQPENKLLQEQEDIRLITDKDIQTDFQTLGIDSLAYIKLIVLLEGLYDIEFNDEDIMLHKLNTVDSFYNEINSILEEKESVFR